MASLTTEYPKRWVFDKADKGKADWIDGPAADGVFVRFEQGRTDYGSKPIAIIEIDGAERSIWLLHDALFNRFRDELSRRSIPKLVAGERIVIRKLAEKVRSKNDREYTAYDVHFLDAPQPDEQMMFNLDPASTTTESRLPESTPAKSAGDDIPF